MSDPDRMEIFLASMRRDLPPHLASLEAYAKENYVPVIRPAAQDFLRTYLAAVRPREILEVGAAIGFSAILMATFSSARITTIEHAPARVAEARVNIEKAGLADRITLLEGDAERILPGLKGSYDFIFMDAAKGQYSAFLPHILRLLAPGGTLLTDNIFQEGELLESHYLVERRDRTIHKRMRAYLRELSDSDLLETTILNVGDGLALSVKKL